MLSCPRRFTEESRGSGVQYLSGCWFRAVWKNRSCSLRLCSHTGRGTLISKVHS